MISVDDLFDGVIKVLGATSHAKKFLEQAHTGIGDSLGGRNGQCSYLGGQEILNSEQADQLFF